MMIDAATIDALLPFIVVGFAAQLIDGAMGMAFGVLTNTMLVTVFGLAPARASATVHVVETFTTAASAISHIAHRNVDWRLFTRLALPGVVGGIIGAYVLSHIDGRVARPFVMAYLSAIGGYLLWRAWARQQPVVPRAPRVVEPLGLAGAFLDAIGGGGWGPMVTSNLLAQGTEPRRTIGTVNTAEFVVTAVISATFIATIGLAAFTHATAGVLIGGVAAAPLGALLARRVPARALLFLVGMVLSATSLYRALA